ncbi:universal stress protein UspA [Rhodospirillum rubrum]|uniref:universal stress protein n=1 Tax=Rhodospirillum rubrum TaxID=1085 RepID=UPI001907D7B7|nr:universal stress protein [Rhodospirillum rubrum]MBK1664576.1 universal stress protein UspA [Rhodospirillum rubrum]MBK1676747.1 universal stress protein UspA [Rhodospirillum rubrum]
MKIVVHVDGGEAWPRRAEAAARIVSTRGGGRVLGLFGQTASALPSYSIHGDKDGIDRDAQPQRDRFESLMANHPGVSAEWHTIHSLNPGFIVGEITANAQFADLTVLGQVDPRAIPERLPSDLAEQVVLNCGRPILLIPYAGTFDYAFERVVIAYNDSRESSRAVGDALPFLSGAEARVIVIRHTPDPTEGDSWRWRELGRRLEEHGLRRVVVETPVLNQIGVADFLLSQAADTAAQLLVMGAYGKLGLPRMLRGSVTRDVLRQMTLPVFLGH